MHFTMFCSVVLVVAFVQPAHAQPPFDGLGGNVSLLADKTRVILGRVTNVSLPPQRPDRQVEFPNPVVYDVEAVCEYQGRVTENAAIRIEGRTGIQGSAPTNIPLLKKGDLLLMAVNVTSDVDRFAYAGAMRLPIGLETPATIDPKDVAELKAALLKLGEFATKGHGAWVREAAFALTQEKNFYLWALGVTSIAGTGTEDDARLFLARYEDPQMSLRQVLWLEYCLGNVFPTQARPSLEQRHQHLLRYLARHA